MLLINFFKEASVIPSVKKSRMYLMLFFSLLPILSVVSQADDLKSDITIDSIIPYANKYYISHPRKAQYYLHLGIRLAEEKKDDYHQGLFLTKMITQKNRERNYDSAKFYFKRAKDFIINHKDASPLLPDVHSEIAETYYYEEELDKALEYFAIADSIYDAHDDDIGVMISKSNISSVYHLQGNYKLAIEYLLEAAKSVDTTQYKYIQTDIYSNVSELYDDIDESKKALEYAKKSLAIAIADEKYPERLIDAYLKISNKYVDFDSLGKAQNQIDEAIKIIDSLKFENRRFNVANSQSIIYLKNDEYNKARLEIEKALDLGKKYRKNKNEFFSLKVNLATCYNNLNQPIKARDILSSALKEAETDGRVNDLATSYRMLAETNAKLNRFRDAYNQHKQYSIHNDSILGIEKQKAIKDSEIKYDTAEKQKQILIQRAELAEQGLVIQKRNYQVFGLAALAFILGLIGFLFYNQQKLKNQQLQKENELKDALIKIETQNKLQEQRLRISRDLHDNIGAQLTFIISSIDNLKYGFNIKDEKLTNKLETISEFTSGTIYELRDTIWAMNKSEITFEDLQTRISNYIDKAHLYDSNIQFAFHVDDNVDTSKKFTSVEGMNIHRVTQEAIHNSLKYAEASRIEVNVSKKVSNYIFKISDNGKGFDLDSVKRGNGLNNMSQRISNIGGEIQINSKENTGTEVVVTI